jgi:hypothetical protein
MGGLGGGGKGGVATATSTTRTEPLFAGLATNGIPYSGGGGGSGVMRDTSWTAGAVGPGPSGSGGSGVIIIKQYGVASAPTIPSSPSDGIAGLVVWLDGSDPLGTGNPPSADAGVSSWVDKAAGNAHSATPMGSSATYKASGTVGGIKSSLGTMLFSNTRYTLPYTNFPRSHTIICLFRVERALVSGGTFQGLGDDCSCYVLGGSADCLLYFGAVNGYYVAGVGPGGAAWGSGMVRPAPDTSIRSQWVIGTMTYDGASKTTNRFLNGIELSSSTDTVQQPLFSGLVIGGPGSQDYRFNGYIGEILIYNSVLSSSDRKKVEAYVSAKYGFGVGV